MIGWGIKEYVVGNDLLSKSFATRHEWISNTRSVIRIQIIYIDICKYVYVYINMYVCASVYCVWFMIDDAID